MGEGKKHKPNWGENKRGMFADCLLCVVAVVFLRLLWQPWEDTPGCSMAGTSAVCRGAGALLPRDEMLAAPGGDGGIEQGIDGVTLWSSSAPALPGEPGLGAHFASHGPSERGLAWRGAKENWLKGPWGQLPALLFPRSLGLPGLILFLLD